MKNQPYFNSKPSHLLSQGGGVISSLFKAAMLISLTGLSLFSRLQSQTINGEANPCGNEEYTYSVANPPSCNHSTCYGYLGTKAPYNAYQWSITEGTGTFISGQNSSQPKIRWDCNANTTGKLKCVITCHYWESYVCSGNGSDNQTCCYPHTESSTFNYTVSIKCPPTIVTISGPSYLPCCNSNNYNYSLSYSGTGDYNIEWEVPIGWTINSGQGTVNINVTPANGANGLPIKAYVWVNGCDRVKAQTIVSKPISRLLEVQQIGTWPKIICQDVTGLNFCVEPYACATYNWSFTTGYISNPFRVGSYPPRLPATYTPNGNCVNNVSLFENLEDNYAYYDINLSISSPCGNKTYSKRINMMHGVPDLPIIGWDGEFGDLCVCRRNVLFWTTNDDPGVDDWEYVFDNGTNTYTITGNQILGTDFCDFGSTWAQNPNSDVTIEVRTHNVCGWSATKTITISAARFKNINATECSIYPAGPNSSGINASSTMLLDGLHLKPNPASKYIEIEWNTAETLGTLLVVNLNGKVVEKKDRFVKNQILDISNLAMGTYIVKIQLQNSVLISKMVIQ